MSLFRNSPTFFFLFLFTLFVQSCYFYDLHADYEVVFKGIENEKTLALIKSVSSLEKLKSKPPSTFLGLKKRAEADIEPITQALHSLAYYSADIDLQFSEDHTTITVLIEPGPVYTFASFHLRFFQKDEEVTDDVLRCPIELKDLDIEIGKPALPEKIISAEDVLLDHLNLQGFAFAKILKRDVFADQAAKNVIIWLMIDLGPLTYIGPTTIEGLEDIHKSFIWKKIRWKEGDLYSPKTIEKTQEALELSGLFRTVNISVAENPLDENLIPLTIKVLESKHRSIGFGLNFTTEFGFGITAEWENRNVLRNGQKLTFSTNLWERLQDARASYLIPDFGRQDQNLIWILDGHHDRNKAYTETTISLSATIERKLTDHLQLAYGGMYKFLRSMRSARNGTFDLVKIPLQLRWTNTDSILEPTKGSTVQLKLIPSLQILKPQFAYSINTLTTTFYRALTKDKRHIFATKLMLGTIIGANKYDIPPPERFYAGSESSIRGYRFLTISPLEKCEKPIGGRSLLVYTLEMRSRIGENLGCVLFYDVGNVYKNYYPDFNKKVLQATGLGLRYYTPIGPLRLDLAFPLDRRHKRCYKKRKKYIDHFMEAYFSIGQSF